MKRSEINRIIRQSMAWIQEMNVHLPPFAYWTVQEWESRGSEYDEIRENMLGWDITDFGKGDFSKTGLVLFTIRNGNLKQPQFHKPYAEKMLICDVNQVTPIHYHWSKMEDIINRGGGILAIQLWNTDDNNGLARTDVHTRIDGRSLMLPAGSIVRLFPGESITLSQGQYHQFWAEGSCVLAWEVSMVNDDNADNCFYEPLGRFSSIEEDEPQKYLLCNEYHTAIHQAPPLWLADRSVMIVDRVDHLDRYTTLGSHYAIACDFVRSHNIRRLAIGRQDIDGEHVYGIVTELRLLRRPPAFEVHELYADIHIVLSGAERFYVSRQKILPEEGRCWENDSGMYRRLKAQSVMLLPGEFIIFFPFEPHLPNCPAGTSVTKKLVIKVLDQEECIT